MTDVAWMSYALKQASRSGQDVPVGAVVVFKGEIVGRGCNQREAKGDPAGHAEIVALRQAAKKLSRWRLWGVTIYTTLEPCPMCAEAIIQARVSRLVFGAYDPVSGAAGSVFNLFTNERPYPIPDVLGGICEQACQDLLVTFFRGKNKTVVDNAQS